MEEDPFTIENSQSKGNGNDEDDDEDDEEEDGDIAEMLDYYKGEMEEALTWILEAEEHLIDIDLMEKNLPEVRKIFKEHEDFINSLKDIQIEVAKLLGEGQAIVDSEECPPEERTELELQMNLLNERLEQLSLKTLEFRKNIHETLMILQQKQINHLRNWLFTAEDKLSQFTDFGSDLVELKKQLTDYQNFQQDFNVQEEIVDSLRDLVWIYDDCEGSSPTMDKPPDELQDQLAPLAEKWNMVRKFIHERKENLEDIVHSWENFTDEENKFNSWRAKLDRRLREMEEAAADMHIGSSFVGELVKRLERMEAEMDRQRSLYLKIGEESYELINKLGSKSAAGLVITRKMETLKEVWEATVQRMNTLSHVVSKINEASLDELSTDNNGEESMTEGNEILKQVEGESSHHINKQQQQQQQQKQQQKVATPTTPNQLVGSSAKKRRLDSWLIQEWQKALDVFTTWLTGVEEVIGVEEATNENCTTSWNSMSLEEQQIFLEDTESDLEMRRQEFDSLVTKGNEFVDELTKCGENEESSSIKQIVETVNERWCRVNRTLRERQLRRQGLVQLNRMVVETGAMSLVLESAKKFLREKTTSSLSDLSPDILKKIDENCKLRIKVLSAQEDKISKLRKELEDLKRTLRTAIKEPSYQKIVSFFNEREQVNEQLCNLLKKVSESLTQSKLTDGSTEKQIQVTQQQQQQQQSSTSNGCPSDLNQKVDSSYERLVKLKETKFSKKPKVYFDLLLNANQLDEYNQLLNEIDNEGKHLKTLLAEISSSSSLTSSLSSSCKEKNFINLSKQQQQGQNDNTLVKEMRDKCNSSQEIWEFCHNECLNRIANYRKLETSLTTFDDETSILESEVEQLTDFLNELRPALGDIQTLESDVEQCNKVLDDIKITLESNCALIILKSEQLIAEFDEFDDDNNDDSNGDNNQGGSKCLQDRMDKLKEKCLMLRMKASDKIQQLETALNRSKNVCQSFEKLERDIESLSFETDEVKHSVVDDYQKSFKSGRTLQERLRKTNDEANKLSKLLNNLSPSHQPTTESLEEMKSKTETIKETLKTLIESIEEYLTTLKQNHSKFGEFTRLIMMEKDWLDKLDRKLKRSPQTAADAEEISGNHDDLETYLRHRPVERSDRIHKLANELIAMSFFSDSVEIEINKVDQRWKSLQHQAHQRLQDLESSITYAQQCDSQILKVQKWIQDVDCLLQQRFDEDILAEDMPDEVDKLDLEFKSNKQILDTLTESIENYRSQERLEAASRLEEQLAILNSQYQDLVMKFKKYQHPTDFAIRLNSLSKKLNELMDNLIDLKVNSYEYTVIQEEFNECRKLVQEIDNVREEIDKVKKQTSLAVDFADDPEDLVREVDVLEKIYENLSQMASERKQEIEKVMEISSTVMNLLYELKNWLNQQEDPSSVDQREFGQKKDELRQLNEKVQLLFHIIGNKDNNDKLRLNIETIVSDFELLEEKMSRKYNSEFTTRSNSSDLTQLTTKQSSSLKSLSKQRQLGLQRSIDLSEGIDSNQSSPKSTTSRKGSLSRTITATAASEGLPILSTTRTTESNTVKLLNFFTLPELEDIDYELQNIQIYLNTCEILNKGDFIEQKQQLGALKKIQNTMESHKPKIHKMVAEKMMINTIHPQGSEYIPLIESIWTHWQALRESFMKRHRRWWFAKETRIQNDTTFNQIKSFLDMAEKTLAASRLPTGELNIEVAKKEDEPLRTAFNEHVPVFGTFKVMTKKIMADLPDGGEKLVDRITLIDEKWKSVVRDLAWRKERLHNEDKNMDVLGYWNQLETWIGKVNKTLAKLEGKIESFEMANILQNEVKFLEQELQTQWLNMMTIQLAPTMIIEKDVDTMEKDFFKLIIGLPEARISIDKYLTSFKVVSRMLDDEIDWTSTHLEEETKPIEDASVHETNYEKLIVMLQEIENDANKFGHKPPSFLKEKMDCLKGKRELLHKKMRLNADPSSTEWYNWLNSQVDYITITFKDCSDERVLEQLKNIVNQIEKQIAIHEDLNSISSNDNNKDHDVLEDDQSAELETMNKNISSYRWNSLKEKMLALQIRLEANSGDELNQLLLSLRELNEWVIKKRSDYSSLGDIIGDVSSLTKQQDDLTNLSLSLDEERPIIETTLMSGRSHLSKGDSQGYDEISGSRNRDKGEINKITQSIQWEVERLSEKWSELLKVIDHRKRRLDDIMRKMVKLQFQMDELSSKLCIADMTRNKWIPISEIAVDQLPEVLNELQTFRDNIYPLQRFVDQMNGSATRISGSQVLLSDGVLNCLEELNTRWKLIQVSIEERRKNLEQAVIDHNTAQQRFLNDAVENPWERAVAFNKVPYYINHETETTHWDHPKMTELINTLNEFNEVRYSAYRTAMKLRSVQRHLCLDLVKFDGLIEIFYNCGLAGQNEKHLNVPEIITVLQTIYTATASGDQAIVINVPLSIDLCLNWLLNLYDTANRTGFIRALSLKIGLVTLCKGTLEEKYRYMFNVVADNGLVDERALGILLHDFIQVPRLLGEIAFGGNNVEPSVRSCFDLAARKSEIELIDFLAWLQREPQSTVWLPVLHRLAAAEKAKHQSKCNVCKQFPIIGFRYKCLLCFNFDMCQICFFSGRTLKNHKNIHPMQEYCLTTSSGQDIKDFTRIIRNKFKSKRYFKRHPKFGYLPVQTVESDADVNTNEGHLNSPTHTLQHPDSLDMHSKLEIYASRLAEVELDDGQDRNFDNYEELDDDRQSNAQYHPEYDISSLTIPRDRLITTIAPDQRNELESIINGLEQENRQLQAEYERLKIKKSQQVNGKSSTNVQSDSHHYSTIGSLTRGGGDILTVKAEVDPYASLISSREEILSAEKKALRSKEDELEVKRILLEEQNKRLEATLKRLRQFLSKFPDATSLSNTLRSTHSDYATPAKLLSSAGRLHYSTNNSMASLRVNGSSDSHHHLNHHQSSNIANHSDETANR